jgi:putative flippase GtrA
MEHRRLYREASAYVAASAVAFGLDFTLLAAQVSLLGLPYLPAAAISFLAGTLFVYWASIRHVFEYRRVEDARHELGIFVTIGALGLVVNLAVLYVVVGQVGLHYLLGKCVAAGATFTLNFALRRWVLFTAWDTSGEAKSVPRGNAS